MIEEIKAILWEKKNLANDTWFFKFKLLKPEKIEFKAGQYLLLKIGNQRRSYSIASPDWQKDSLEFVIKLLPEGVGSNYLRNLPIGAKSYFLGPVGFFTLKSKEKNKIFFAGGTGIAPIRSQILSILKETKKSPKLILFWGLKTKKDVYFFDEFFSLCQKNPNFKFKICLDQEKNFENLNKNYFLAGRVQKAFLDFKEEFEIFNVNDFEYYLCGPPPMVQALKEFLLENEVKKENIFFERF